MFNVRYKVTGRIDRIVDLESVSFTDMKVVGSMTQSGVHTAGSGLTGGLIFETNIKLDLGICLAERNVLGVHDQRSTIEPRMTRLQAIERRALESRDLFVLGETARFGKSFRELRGDDVDL